MAGTRLRIVSYNIAALSVERAGVLATLERLTPDLIGLQEVDRGTARSGHVDQAQQLAASLGMRYAYAAAMPFDGGEYGIAILARSELRDLRVLPLPREGREEPRVAMFATSGLPDGRAVRIANTHLAADWHAQNPAKIREAQVTELVRVLKEEVGASPNPLFLVGDFNCDSDSAALSRLNAAARKLNADLLSNPAIKPTAALDHAFYMPASHPLISIEVRHAQTDPSTASDHLPLVIDIEIHDASPGVA
jgi:endonuclease/exonuclease/phosphatase family metal-dependent hydrolase